MDNSIDGTLKHIVFLARHLGNCDLQCATTAMLLDLGIPVKGSGFDYLERAIIIYFEDPTQMLTKDIYPDVGKSFSPKAGSYQVERAIRVAINEAWKNRDSRIWGYYFASDRKPSNGEFISRMARILRLWQGCSKGVKHE